MARPRMPAPTTTTSQGCPSVDRGLRDSAGAVEEVEVAALVGLGHVAREQALVAAGGGELSGHPGRTARGELVFRDVQVEAAVQGRRA